MAIALDKLRAKITEALEFEGTYTFTDVIRAVQAKQMQWFENDDGCLITEIRTMGPRKWMNIICIAGELPGVFELRHKAFAEARENGCTKVIAGARLGWKKIFDKMGWETKAIYVVHDLNEKDKD